MRVYYMTSAKWGEVLLRERLIPAATSPAKTALHSSGVRCRRSR